MIRRIRRTDDVEVTLVVKNESYIRPPRDAQRNWLLNSVMSELMADLGALHRHAARFVTGRDGQRMDDRTQAPLADDEIMEDWQIPLMKAMAALVTERGGDVLEVGFGRGVSAGFIQDAGVHSHTIIECNENIVRRCEAWRERYPGRDIRIAAGLWQDELPQLSLFDAIFFHTYPLDETDMLEQIANSSTFAEHFFADAAAHLRPGGCFTYLSNEIDSLGRAHQRALLRHFSELSIRVVGDLPIPDDVRDAWWSDSMVLVKAIR